MPKQTSIAKITRPRLPEILPRPRLFRLLDQGRKSPITWVSGPGGSGKTTLVASWLDSRKLPCLWYQVDEGDSDIASFFYYMGLAAKKAAPGYKRPLPLLTPEYLLGIPTFTRRYFENLCGRLKKHSLIVIDNYQEVPDVCPFHEMMQHGLSGIPLGIDVIVVSRADPPPVFTGMLAKSKMHFVDWSELRLTPEESKGLVQLQGIRDPHGKLCGWMHEKTQGWTGGLVLLSRAVRTENLDPEAIEQLSPEKVFDYFANELFDRADESVQEFLLKTAFAPTLTVRLAAKLTGNKAAGHILSDLNRRNYFTEKRQQKELTYQYHSLFREFLLARAKTALSPETIHEVRSKAAMLLEASGQAEDAAELFMQAEAWKELISLILGNAQTLVGQGRNKFLEKWITTLPDGLLSSEPWLYYWLGFCRMPFDIVEGRRCFERSFGIFEGQHNTEGAIVAWAAIVNAIWHEWDDYSRMDYWIEWMEKALKKNASSLSPQMEASISSGMMYALFRRQPYHASLTAWMERALQLTCNAPVSLFLQVRMAAFMYAITRWDQKKCRTLLEEMRDALKGSSPSPLDLMIYKATEAQFDTMCNASNEKVLKNIREHLRLGNETGIRFLDHCFYAIGAYCALHKGDLDLAGDYLGKMSVIVSEKQRDGLTQYLCLAGWRDLLAGDISIARGRAERALKLSLETGVLSSEVFCHNLMLHVWIKQGDFEQASRQNALAKKVASRIGSEFMMNLCLLAEAQLAFTQGNEQEGLKALRSAFALGRKIDFASLIFHWQPAIMAELCAKALENGIEVEYASRLIRGLQLVPTEPHLHTENWPWRVKIYTLGGFRLLLNDKLSAFSGKIQKKPLEMLKILIAVGGKDVREDQLMDALWSEADGDAARSSYRTTLHRLRQLVGNEKAITVNDGQVSLDPRYCWVDAWAFEKAVRSAEFGTRNSNSKSAEPESEIIQHLEQALQLYRGHFLDGEDRPWATSPRERMKNKFLRTVELLGSCWTAAGQPRKAMECYESGLEIDDLTEEFYQGLMACNLKLGKKTEAIKVYKRCKEVLTAGLGVGPSPESEKIFRSVSIQPEN